MRRGSKTDRPVPSSGEEPSAAPPARRPGLLRAPRPGPGPAAYGRAAERRRSWHLPGLLITAAGRGAGARSAARRAARSGRAPAAGRGSPQAASAASTKSIVNMLRRRDPATGGGARPGGGAPGALRGGRIGSKSGDGMGSGRGAAPALGSVSVTVTALKPLTLFGSRRSIVPPRLNGSRQPGALESSIHAARLTGSP